MSAITPILMFDLVSLFIVIPPYFNVYAFLHLHDHEGPIEEWCAIGLPKLLWIQNVQKRRFLNPGVYARDRPCLVEILRCKWNADSHEVASRKA